MTTGPNASDRPRPQDRLEAPLGKRRRGLAALGALLVLALSCGVVSLQGALSSEAVMGWAAVLRDSAWGPLLALGIFVLGSLVGLPVLALIAGTALVFGPGLGFVYALSGTVLAAAATYAVGHALGYEAVCRLAGGRMRHWNQRLARHGLLAMMLIRWVPVVAPFTVVNLLVGASQVRFRDFVLGTLLGMVPVTLALALSVDGIVAAARNPRPGSLGWLAGALAVAGLLTLGVRRWSRRLLRDGPSSRPSPPAGERE